MQSGQNEGDDNSVVALSKGQKAFIGVVLVVGLVAMALGMASYLKPPAPSKDVAQEARNLLRSVKAMPLTEALKHYIETGDGFFVDSEPHPLLGKTAPPFRLPNHRDEMTSLESERKRGPVILVFYLGYTCDHCVSQLFGLNEDLKYFSELGATVVAISPDSTEKTASRFKQFGSFGFPTLSDANNQVSRDYGVYQPATATDDEKLLHATFVIDGNGIVRWAKLGETPFYHNPTLLREVAKLSRTFAPPVRP